MQLAVRTKHLLKAKIKAYFIHLLLSLVVFFVVLYVLLKHWYPGPFFIAHGGWNGVKILFFVDMVLGPLITLFIYNCYKKTSSKVFDLSVIAIIQIAALIWGVGAIYSKKPAALVFWEDRFYTVSMDYFQERNIDQQQLNAYGETQPPIIFAKKPTTKEGLIKKARLTRDKKIPPFAQVGLYESIKLNMAAVLKYSYPYNGLLERNPGRFQELNSLSNEERNNIYGGYLVTKHSKLLLLLTTEGDFVGYLVDKE